MARSRAEWLEEYALRNDIHKVSMQSFVSLKGNDERRDERLYYAYAMKRWDRLTSTAMRYAYPKPKHSRYTNGNYVKRPRATVVREAQVVEVPKILTGYYLG
jgi:hypothetical protein